MGFNKTADPTCVVVEQGKPQMGRRGAATPSATRCLCRLIVVAHYRYFAGWNACGTSSAWQSRPAHRMFARREGLHGIREDIRRVGKDGSGDFSKSLFRNMPAHHIRRRAAAMNGHECGLHRLSLVHCPLAGCHGSRRWRSKHDRAPRCSAWVGRVHALSVWRAVL